MVCPAQPPPHTATIFLRIITRRWPEDGRSDGLDGRSRMQPTWQNTGRDGCRPPDDSQITGSGRTKVCGGSPTSGVNPGAAPGAQNGVAPRLRFVMHRSCVGTQNGAAHGGGCHECSCPLSWPSSQLAAGEERGDGAPNGAAAEGIREHAIVRRPAPRMARTQGGGVPRVWLPPLLVSLSACAAISSEGGGGRDKTEHTGGMTGRPTAVRDNAAFNAAEDARQSDGRRSAPPHMAPRCAGVSHYSPVA